jgi:tRNA (guanine-N7-)-methyltransferase
MNKTAQDYQKWRFYGRRSGRKLNSRRQAALDKLLPRLEIPQGKITEKQDLDPATLFGFAPEKIVFEIGFGNGERLAEAMKRSPSYGFIGAEPFINGMSSFLCDIEAQNTLKNIAVCMDNAVPLACSLEPESIDEIYILNPDPWHKKRHHNRRIVNPENLDHFARILKPGGLLYLSTDVEPLAEWMITKTINHPAFHWTAIRADDWRKPPLEWISTRYETKQAKGAGKMNYMIFEKIS